MKQVKIFFGLMLTLIIFAAGFYIAYNIFKEEPLQVVAVSVEDIADKKLRMEDAVIEKVHSKKELITFEAELSDMVEWDDSWGTLAVFSKSQKIRFYGTGIYTVDLALVSENDVNVDMQLNQLSIALPKPTIKSITINEDKTEYSNVENGWFRFGDISITPEQYNSMYAIVKENMRSSLESPDVYDQAEHETRTVVREFLQTIAGSFDGVYTVRIVWK